MYIERTIQVEVTCPRCGAEFEQEVFVTIEVESGEVIDEDD